MNVYSEYSDEKLVSLTLHGDNDAYCELVTRYKKPVFKTVSGAISDYYAAQDMAQETFIDGYLHLSSLKEPAKIRAWLNGIAIRKALHFVMRRKPHENLEEFSEILFAESASPEDILIRKETSETVRKALYHLSEKSRAVTEPFYWGDLSVAEIARQLDLPEGTVKRRLHDARNKLKGELFTMKDSKQTLSPDFEKTVREKIKWLGQYYSLNGDSYDGFREAYSETENVIAKLPESRDKQYALAGLYMSSYWANEKSETLKKKIITAAQNGNNADALCDLLVDDILGLGDDYNVWIKRIDEEALPQIEKMNSAHNKGILLFWRGASNMRLKKIDEAKNDFTEAAALINPENDYHANAIAALKAIDRMLENAENPFEGYNIMGECVDRIDGKFVLESEPGFGGNAVMYGQHQLDALFYFISRCDGLFYDTSMKIGGTYKSRDGKSGLSLIALDEAVEVRARRFEKCMHLHYSCPQEYDADIWYADGTGLIKVVFSGDKYGSEEYELETYDIKGGTGYMPAFVGNSWRYVKPDLPDYLYQCFEREIDWTDGKAINYSVIQLVAMRKNYLAECELDSDFYLAQCDELCGEWKLDEAFEKLRLAVRRNSSQNAAFTALAGIDYLTRFREYQKKGYRFCPSSMNASYLTVKSGTVQYEESGAYSFGPTRWGSRFEENRIFGVKPFRYLQTLTGRVYDEKWVVGYHEDFPVDDGAVTAKLAVTDGGTVTVKAGTFENCLKVTITAEYGTMGENYYFNNFRYTHCGKKEFWFAPGVGIVRFDYTWGTSLKSSSELVSYSTPAAGNEMMPVYIGSRWEYDEKNLTAEGYRAKRVIHVACGMDGKYLADDAQEFIYLGTEKEYEAFRRHSETAAG